MSVDWSQVSLKDITSILGDGLHGTPKYDESGEYFFINGNNLDNGNIVITEKTKRASKSEYEKHKKDLNDRTILVSINGTLGNIAFYNGEKVFLGKSACYFNVNPDVDKHYVRYVLESRLFQDYIHNLATGSTIKNVSLKLMRDFSFKLPPKDIQESISRVLKDMDDNIQNNRKINRTLEQIAQAIFKSWFVDFEPVKAKMAVLKAGGTAEQAELAAMSVISAAGHGSPNAASAGRAGAAKDETALKQLQAEQPDADAHDCMDAGGRATQGAVAEGSANVAGGRMQGATYTELAQTAALFPAAMVDSELGDIPEGWAPVRIDSLLELAYGKALKKTDRINGNYPVYGSGGVNGSHNKPLVSGPGIIIGRKGTVGSIYWEQQDFCPIDTVFYVKPKAGVSLEFCFYLLQTLGLSEMNTDAAVPGLNRNNVCRLEVPNYPDALITYFTRITGKFVNKISSNKLENTILSKARDTLLPKLLSGEITLPNTEEA